MKTETQALRDQIVEEFLQAQGTAISGAALSDAIGVSRTAIWKHIHQLEELGFVFESAPKVGHRLIHTPDVLMEPLLKRALPTNVPLGQTVVFSPEVDSTNRLATELAQKGAPHGTLVTSQLQTSGRGRRGKSWFSHPGGAWFSLILRHPVALNRAFELTLLASIAIRRAIAELTKLPVKIKWPNDLLVNDRKVCGILAEIRSDGEQIQQAIVGIGINCNIPEAAFPESVQGIATSLLAESGQAVNRTQLVARFLEEYHPMIEALCHGDVAFERLHEEWCTYSHTLGRTISVQTGGDVVQGRAIRLEPDGTLIVETPSHAELSIHSGEVLFS